MHAIKHRLFIRTSCERLYDAIACADGIRNWWTTEVAMDERIGGSATFSFYDGTQHNGVRIDERTPHRRVAWTMTSSSIPDLVGSAIGFEIAPAGDDAMLDFTQSGLPRADEVFAIFNSGWYLYLSSLRQYLETGHGHPHPYLDFAHPRLWFEASDTRSAKPGIAYGVAQS